MAALAVSATAARANSDSLTVTITPSASYSVTVSTGGVSPGYLNLGSVLLNGTTQTVQPSTITVSSTYEYTGLSLSGNITSPGGTPWTFSPNTAAAAQDKLAAWVVFTDTSVQTMPALGSFLGTVPGGASDVVQAASLNVGNTATIGCPALGATGKSYIWAAATPGYKPMECTTTTATDAAGGLSFVWMKFTLPPATTDGTHAQFITYTLLAGAPN
jgi:hypothetical protein